MTRSRNRPARPLAVALATLGPAGLAFFVGTADLRPAKDLTEGAGLPLVILLFSVVGLLVVRAQLGNAVGWTFLATGALLGLVAAIGAYLAAGEAAGVALSLAAELEAVENMAWISGLMLALTYAILLFPDGRPPTRRWRPVVWAVPLVLLAAVASDRLDDVTEAAPIVAILDPLSLLGVSAITLSAVGSLVVRWRRSRGIERQQLKWVAAALVLLGAGSTANLLVEVLGPRGPAAAVVFALFTVALGLYPISVGIAILRYRLYDIDVLINRTLVYASLSAVLAGTYVVSVLALTALLRPITGSGDLAVAGSTLAVVALFAPLRARIQRFVDRRFYRSRYDAARTVDVFAARLRDQVDLDELSGELVGVIHETLQPAHASLWLRQTR